MKLIYHTFIHISYTLIRCVFHSESSFFLITSRGVLRLSQYNILKLQLTCRNHKVHFFQVLNYNIHVSSHMTAIWYDAWKLPLKCPHRWLLRNYEYERTHQANRSINKHVFNSYLTMMYRSINYFQKLYNETVSSYTFIRKKTYNLSLITTVIISSIKQSSLITLLINLSWLSSSQKSATGPRSESYQGSPHPHNEHTTNLPTCIVRLWRKWSRPTPGKSLSVYLNRLSKTINVSLQR